MSLRRAAAGPLSIVSIALATAGAPAQPANQTLTAVDGILVGQYTLAERPTGCTVVVAPAGAVGGVSQRGGSPGTRETDLLDPLNMVDRVNAIVLAGGSAFGLEAAAGAVRWLEEHDMGWPTPAGRVPIVPAAILYDLAVGDNPRVRPGADCGYRAAAAATGAPVQEGSLGAGAGATVGKLGGPTPGGGPTKTGIGSAAVSRADGLVVGAIAAVNAAGQIVDPSTGRIVAGVRTAGGTFADLRALLRAPGAATQGAPGQNTTIAVVATNAALTKAEASRVALMADDGLARAIVPSHTVGDGDTVFALGTGTWAGTVNLTTVGALAAEALAEAIVRAGTEAVGLPGLPAARDLRR